MSGPGLSADHARAFGQALLADEIARRAESGCNQARQSLDRHVSRLARGLAAVVNILDPEAVVLGGGLSNMAHLYDELPRLMAPHIFSSDSAVRILPPAHGDDSGARGAARLWDRP